MKPSTDKAAVPAVIPFTKADTARATTGTGERWLLALMAIFLMHVIIFGTGGIAEALSRRMSQPWRVLPHDPMILVIGSFLMAQCSLAATGLGRSRLASHWKALLAIGLATGIWILLHVALLGHAKGDSEVGSWLAALVTQGLAVAFGIQAVELLASPKRKGGSRQYTILGLLIWTTIVAGFLSGMRWLASLLGWTSDVSEWPSFFPLQALAAFSAILAILLCVIVSWSASWRRTAAFSTLALVGTTAAFVAFTQICFKAPGATAQEMCWIMGGQTLFLLAVLIPLRSALQPRALEPPLEMPQ